MNKTFLKIPVSELKEKQPKTKEGSSPTKVDSPVKKADDHDLRPKLSARSKRKWQR